MKKYPLSVLKFRCHKDLIAQILKQPNKSYRFGVSSFEVEPYNLEFPFTLQTDAAILVNENELIIDFEYKNEDSGRKKGPRP